MATTSSGGAGHCSSSSCGVKKQKRQISIVTFHKYTIASTIVCFGCVATRTVKTGRLFLLCGVITGMKNFSRIWIDGSLNHRVSSVVDHATST